MRLATAVGSRRRNARRLVTSGTALVGTVGLALAVLPSSSVAVASDPGPAPETSPLTSDAKLSRDFDIRRQGASEAELARRGDKLNARAGAGLGSLRRELGRQGVVSLDPLTGTARNVSRLDGFLTGPSDRPPSTVALGYVRSHAGALGLDAADLGTLRLRRTYTDIAGTRHLSYVQYSGSIPVFGNGLKAHVSRDGRLVSVQGSPVHDLTPVGTSTGLGAAAARRAALKDVSSTIDPARARSVRGAARRTVFQGRDRASLVAFWTLDGPRLAWQTLTTADQGGMFLHVVDAQSGRVLFRRSLTHHDSGAVWEYWPGRSRGGRQAVVDLTRPGWLPAGSPRLAGNNAHAWSDVNDDNLAQRTEEVTPGRNSFRFGFVDFTKTDGPPCATGFRCSWNNKAPRSWNRNRQQNAVQVFYYVNRMHDHLRAAPIGFTRAAGNFEAVDDDAVQTQTDDGANTAGGLPDSNHVDNANMDTPPDGVAPRMQMYLFNDPAADGQDPFLQGNSGDEADIVYHEYVHGLSNRLVVDPSGVSTLGGLQAGSMGEAWSDWYAMDHLANLGLQQDTAVVGDVRIGQYVGRGQNLIRTEPLDCPVGVRSPRCPGTATALRGGYTYGDFGRILDIGPEVHADGEIWGQTLWDLRKALGSRLTESLVTRAMELSPANPSFLDERNAIVQADTVVNRGRARATIWKVFAHRGMGYFAGSVDGDDSAPVEDFSLPPVAGTPHGYLTGVVRSDTGAPLAGATVAFGGHNSGFPGSYQATSAADGRYLIRGVYAGTYPKVWAGARGYDREVRRVSIRSGRQALNWVLRRDWAALPGGATLTETNDDTGAVAGCGAAALFDQSQGNGWSAERRVVDGQVTPVFVIVELPSAVDVSEVAVDPTGTCGDAGSASTGPYTLETSTDGTTWTTASTGTFTPEDRGHFSSLPLAAGSTSGVRFVRYTMRDSQVLQVGSCPGAFSGCDFIDSRELEVYGTPATP